MAKRAASAVLKSATSHRPPMRLPPLPTIREVVKLYRLNAVKQLSQNFLFDSNLTDKIVKSAGNLEGAFVCEVGPGPGGITRSILKAGAAKVVVVELDRRFNAGLRLLQAAAPGRVEIVNDDILTYNMAKALPLDLAVPWEGEPPNVHIIGNLPFNVSTPLIIRWLEALALRTGPFVYGRTQLTLTFQKEVCERICAPPRTSQRSRLSIMSQYLCQVKHCFRIPGKCFVPKPDVDVGVVHFTPLVRPRIQGVPFKAVEKVVKHVFHLRGKYCRRGAAELFPPERPDLLEDLFSLSEVDSTVRPWQLTMTEWDRLAHAYWDICQREPWVSEYDFRARTRDKFQIPPRPDILET
ncbi:Dimethyladenosine transferase 1, mitochondrial [Branchiostoma belcheri]|nr:Dimethyladenosine transferase 1, mitochondrial [Branchiostoma belcheri]